MAFVSPMLKIRCVYCRKEFHPSDAMICSATDFNKIFYMPPRQGSLGSYASRFWATELTGAKYTTAMARRVCPFCHSLLPERETDVPLNLAIVGDTSSGKTHFIAVLIDQLKHGLLMQAGSGSTRLISLSMETDRKYRDEYYIPILQDKNARTPGTKRGSYSASGTPELGKPLVYQLTLSDNQSGNVKSVNLIFYDISGEEIADSTLIVQFGEHIFRADGIIYLADPIAMERVRDKLPAHLQPDPSVITSRTAHEVLANVMFRFEQYQRIPPGGTIDIPTAIMLTKSDLLKYTIPVSAHRNYLIFQDKVYDGKAYPQEYARIHQEVGTCLNAYGERALLQASTRFTNMNFFAVSATGGPPDGSGHYVALEPQRCLDPFVWMLWKLGYIEAAQSLQLSQP